MRTYLNGYEIMWMYVMFDLPVTSKKQRKLAHDFRMSLLDHGFSMGQFSVYYKVVAGKEAVEAESRSIRTNLPSEGKVDVLSITDKQYKGILSFEGHEQREKPGQQSYFAF